MRTILRGWRRFYGENPLHLLSMVGCFALVGYTMQLIWEDPSLYAILIWFVGALLVHDLLLYPLYVLADQTLTVSRWARRRALPRTPPLVPAINHIRVPVLGSALVGLIWLPTLAGRNAEAFEFAAGLPIVGRYENWLLVTAVLFLGSAVLYALRLGVAGGRRLVDRMRRPGPEADPVGPSEQPTEALPTITDR